MPRIGVFGLGYVGSVTAATFASWGNFVIGVDKSQSKINELKQGNCTILEPGLCKLLKSGLENDHIVLTNQIEQTVLKTDIGFICVGTPNDQNGEQDLKDLMSLLTQIGQAITQKKATYTIVVRSTILPGTTSNLLIPLLDKVTGSKAGQGYDILFHPEFLREGSAISDFNNPSRIIVGSNFCHRKELLRKIYQKVDTKWIETSFEIAEFSKYVDNAFHALKITFANEIGQISQLLEVDSRDVLQILCADPVLNISSKYLKPGFAFGGSCLPKDLDALTNFTKRMVSELPLIEGISCSNHKQIEALHRRIEVEHPTSVGIIGGVFKPGINDLRGSSYLELARRLQNGGLPTLIFDPVINLIDYPELSSQNFVSQVGDLKESDVIIIAHSLEKIDTKDLLFLKEKKIFDLSGYQVFGKEYCYQGLYW